MAAVAALPGAVVVAAVGLDAVSDGAAGMGVVSDGAVRWKRVHEVEILPRPCRWSTIQKR